MGAIVDNTKTTGFIHSGPREVQKKTSASKGAAILPSDSVLELQGAKEPVRTA